jgi:hypothetical protein
MNMQLKRHVAAILRTAAAAALILGTGTTEVMATEPCGDFGECIALIEINATDGDIGFQFLMDGDDLNSGAIHDPNGAKVFEDQAKGPLREQKLTETFAESAEPLCWNDPEADPDDEIVTLEEFLERWAEGPYVFSGMGDGGEKSSGETELTHALPAAPADVEFDGSVVAARKSLPRRRRSNPVVPRSMAITRSTPSIAANRSAYVRLVRTATSVAPDCRAYASSGAMSTQSPNELNRMKRSFTVALQAHAAFALDSAQMGRGH